MTFAPTQPGARKANVNPKLHYNPIFASGPIPTFAKMPAETVRMLESERLRARNLPASQGPILSPCHAGLQAACSRRCQMTSVADRIAGPPLAAAADVVARDAATAQAAMPAISLPAAGERELRLDLFRGTCAVADLYRSPAAQSFDVAHDPQLRIQRRHRNIHFYLGLHGRVRLRPRDARGRLRGRDRAHPAAGLADLCRARVSVYDLPRGNFLRRDQLREPAVHAKKWASWIFSRSRTSPSSRPCS